MYKKIFNSLSKKYSIFASEKGALVQLVRIFDWQSKGQRFESAMLHEFLRTLFLGTDL